VTGRVRTGGVDMGRVRSNQDRLRNQGRQVKTGQVRSDQFRTGKVRTFQA